jgi:2-methylcitrate dehydratase PrpD
MPAKSAAQQKAAGAALSAKRGETSPSELKGASKSMYKSMSEKQLDEFASTKRKGKPEHVSKSKKE